MSPDAGPREERRVVTVVFTDLVGFTERSEELDPEDVRSLLTAYYTSVRSILEEHGGTVDKFIGDAVLGVFGAPVAHEDDPERAVRAALAVCAWAARRPDIDLRAGVNTGTALVALELSDTGIGMVAGDMVNTASRIQSAAPTGRVLVGEQTQRATAHAFAFAEHDPIEAKGKSARLRVWEPLAARVEIGARARRGTNAPLVGRRDELDTLSTAFERVPGGESAHTVTLVGVPGIGKTRLAMELARVVRERAPKTIWLEGRSLPYGAGTSFRALGEMVRTYAGIGEQDDTGAAAAKLDQAVTALSDDESEVRWVSSQLRPLIGVTDAADGGDQARADASAAWRRLFELVAARAPLVLVFDDLHWADDAMLDFITELVSSARAGMLVLGTARPELLEHRPAWTELPHGSVVRLEPLSPDETDELFHLLVHSLDVGVDMERALVARAAGNPLYAEEFVRMIVEGARSPDEELPQSVHGIIAARLDAVSPAEKDLLQDGCVIGPTFWPAALRHLGNRDVTHVDELLAGLERKEFVLISTEPALEGEPEIVFRHPLIREVAYEQLPRARRAEKHRLAAEWAETLPANRAESRTELLAEHYVSAFEYTAATGGDVRDLQARAARSLRESGDRARALHSLDEAAARYTRALELAGGNEDRADISLALAETQLRTGALDDAQRRLDEVIVTARTDGRADLLARAALARGGVGVRVFDPDEAVVALLQEALEEVGTGQPALRARLLARLSIEVYYEDPSSVREALSEEAVRVARAAGQPDALLDALNARRVTLWSPDRLQERLEVSRELVELAESTGDRERSLVARTWLVVDLVERGDLDGARAEIETYARLVAPLGIPAYAWWVPAWRAMLAGLDGRFDDLRALSDEAYEIGSRAGDGNAEIYRGLARWIADVEQGRDSEGWIAQIAEGVARGGPSDAFRCGLAMQYALAGRLDDARDALAALGPLGLAGVVKDMNFFAGAGEFTIAVGILGDAERAAQAYTAVLPYASRVFVIARAAVCWGPAESFLGRLAATADFLDEAEAHFEAALAACKRIGARAMEVRTQSWYAEMLRTRARTGDAERAERLATTARANAEELGVALRQGLSE